MTSYLISVIEEQSTWNIAPGEFSTALKRRWPEVVIFAEEPDEVWFKMDPAPGHGYVYAHLQSPGHCVVVEMVDDMRDIVTIAVWFRSLVPENLTVWLYDEAFNDHYPVTPSTTEAELAAAFLTPSEG